MRGSLRVSRDIFRVPRDIFRVPRDIFRVPRDIFRVPRDIFRVPRDIFRVPRDIFRVPRDTFKLIMPRGYKETPNLAFLCPDKVPLKRDLTLRPPEADPAEVRDNSFLSNGE